MQAKKPKRSALMLDKLMFALEKAVNERREVSKEIGFFSLVMADIAL